MSKPQRPTLKRGDCSRSLTERVRLIACALAALAVAGCGGGERQTASLPEDPGSALRRAAERVREESTFRFTLTYTRTRADRPDDHERYAEGEGALDLGAERGRMTFDLDLGLPGQGDVEEPFELQWTRERLEATWQGRTASTSRTRARDTRALMGVLPDEPEALVELLGSGRDARAAGRESLAGEELVRIRFVADARAAGRAGVPPELHGLAAQGGLGATLPMEAWIGPDELPRLIAYEVHLKPTTILKTRLPSRTIRGEYRLEAFGEPFPG